MRQLTSFSVVVVLAIFSNAVADEPIKHRFMAAEYGKGPNRLVEVDADGQLVWEYKFPSIAVIFQHEPSTFSLYPDLVEAA